MHAWGSTSPVSTPLFSFFFSIRPQTYFNDSVEEAKKVVDQCLDKWTGLLARLPEEEAQKLQRSMGLKIEQLKAEFENVRKLHLEDH